jgi:hypothetical protein
MGGEEMKNKLIQLGFKDTSFTDENIKYTELTYYVTPHFTIQISEGSFVEIADHNSWIAVPGCKTIADIKHLIKLFTPGQ